MKYLAAKIGYDPEDPGEFGKAIHLYTAINLVSATNQKTYKFICQMHFNKDAAELDACIANNKMAAVSSFLQ